MLSKLTLLGIHNFTAGHIWDDILLPEGINKDTLIDEIIRESAEFSLVYPDADYLNYQIKSFFVKWNKTFTKWIDVYNTEYNPLYNVEVHTKQDTELIDKQKSHSYGNTQAATNGSNDAQTDSDGLNLTQKAAYDASTLQNVSQISNTMSSSTSMNSSLSSSESQSQSNSAEHSNSMHYEEYKYGNQGVTMSQEMWLAEVDMWYWNIYKHIAEIFVNEFCICIYN